MRRFAWGIVAVALALALVVPGAAGVAIDGGANGMTATETTANGTTATETTANESHVDERAIPAPPAPEDVAAEGSSMSGSAGSGARATEGTEVVQQLTYRFVPGQPHTVEIQIDYEVSDDARAIVLYTADDATVVSMTSFERKDEGHFFTSDDLESASLTIRLTRSPETLDARSGYSVVDGDWGVVSGFPGTAYYSGDTNDWEWPGGPRTGRSVSVDGEGFVGARTVALGNHTVHEREAAGQTLRLVVPQGHQPEASPAVVLDTLGRVAVDLDVGALDEAVNSFYLPTDSDSVLGVAFHSPAGQQDVWLFRPGWRLDNTWVHEYVHTRQSYDLAENMRWFDEASADYYGALFPLRYGVGGYDEFVSEIDEPGPSQGRLADPDAPSYSPYSRGRRVLAALDARIQVATDYRRSLVDVLARINAHSGTVTLADFQDMVEAVAGTNMDSWIYGHVVGTEEVTFRDDPYAYTDTDGSGDPDGDGLTDAAERDAGTHPFRADTDGDELDDGAEIDEYGSDPTVADTDGDGLADGVEADIGSDPTVADTDGDGLSDGAEHAEYGTDPTAADTDGDGLADGRELDLETDPTAADTDGDGLADGEEVEGPTDPTVADTDGDGLADGAEADAGTDPTVADTDEDGLDDGREVDAGTDPTAADTDGDGLTDAVEVDGATDATLADTDGDGLDDGREADLATDPTVADTDGDGLDDGFEVDGVTNATLADTDGDGLDDRSEVRTYDSDPTVADTDGDGLDDSREVGQLGTDPTAADTDGDGVDDAREVDAGTDPTAADTDGDGFDDAAELTAGTDPTSDTGTAVFWVRRGAAAAPGGAVGLGVGAVVLVGAVLALARRRS